MKIFKSIPSLTDENKKVRSIDSPLIPVLKTGIITMLILSGFTITKGLYYQFEDSLFTYGAFLAYTILFSAFLLFVKGLDGVNAAFIAWITRALLNLKEAKTTKQKVTTGILVLFGIIAVFGLTRFSFKLSKFSAEKASTELSGEADQEDTRVLADSSQALINIELSVYDSTKSQTERRYNKAIAKIEAPYRTNIERYQGYIENARKEKTGTELQTYINRQNGNIARQEKAMNAATIAKELERDSILNAIAVERKTEKERLQSIYDQERSKVVALNEAASSEHEKFESTFTDLFGAISGYAVLLLLVFTVALEILLDRSGIENRPVYENIDYHQTDAQEIISHPFALVQHRLVNAVRKNKQAWKPLKEPSQKVDFAGYDSNITDFENMLQVIEEVARRKPAGFFKDKKVEEKEGFTDVEILNKKIAELEAKLNSSDHEKTTNHENDFVDYKVPTKKTRTDEPNPKVVNPNLKLWQLKQKLKKYKKNVGKFSQEIAKMEKKGETIPQRKINALKNNQAWETAIIDRINEIQSKA